MIREFQLEGYIPSLWIRGYCIERGWPPPAISLSTPDSANPELFQATVLVRSPDGDIEQRSPVSGWKSTAIRWATLSALQRLLPSLPVHPEWLIDNGIEAESVRSLQKLCSARNYGKPLHVQEESGEAPWPCRCKTIIPSFPDHGFVGAGLSPGEAKSVAASQALIYLRSLLQRPAPVDVPTSFEARVRGMGASDPILWAKRLCADRAWPEPEYLVSEHGSVPRRYYEGTVTVCVGGATRVVRGPPSHLRKAAARNAALALINELAPEWNMPASLIPPPIRVNPLMEANWLSMSLGFGLSEAKLELASESIPAHIATLSIPGQPTTWTGRGFCTQSAKAAAAHSLLDHLRSVHTERQAQARQASVRPAVEPRCQSGAVQLKDSVSSPRGAPQAPPYSPPFWLGETHAALQSALRYLPPKCRLSSVEDRPAWTLKWSGDLVLTLSGQSRGCISLSSARTSSGDLLALPERVKGRLVSVQADAVALATSIRTLFAEPLLPRSSLPAPVGSKLTVLPKLPAPAPTPHTTVASAPGPARLRAEVEGDPFVKAASGFFRDGFLAYCDNEGESCPWTLDTIRRVEWHLGYDYARLSCSQCGAKNTSGARCTMPEIPDAPEPPATIYDRLRDAARRLSSGVDRPSTQQIEDAALLRDAADQLERLLPPTAQESHSLPPATCLKCSRVQQGARGLLLLNAGLALAKLQDLESESAVAPYRSIKVYGLRRRPNKPEYWAYVVVTNGSLAECLEPELMPYRQHAVLLDPGVLLSPAVRLLGRN